MSEEQTQVFDEDFESFVRRSFAEMRNEFANVDQRLERFEARAYDTKPIWEQALAEILEVKEQVKQINQTMKSFDRQLKILNEDHLVIRADVRGHEQRLEQLEQR